MERKKKRGRWGERKISFDLNLPRRNSVAMQIVKQMVPKRKKRGKKGEVRRRSLMELF